MSGARHGQYGDGRGEMAGPSTIRSGNDARRIPRQVSAYASDRLHAQATASYAASSTSSTSSRVSLSTSFVDLGANDIAFFDEVIDCITPGANDFASLKKAYNRQRAETRPESTADEERDAYLWDILLKLIQVRGKDWAARWDAVRMAVGLEPRVISESEREPSGEDAAISSGIDESSESDTVKDHTERASSPPRLPQSKRANTTREEIEALRRKMAMLSAEAGTLVGSIAKQSGGAANPPLHSVSILTTREERKLRNAHNMTPERRIRFDEQVVEPVTKKSSKATIVESASDEDRPQGSRVLTQSRLSKQNSIATNAQRQFEEVVARSRSERDSQKKAQNEQMEAEKEARLDPLFHHIRQRVSLNLARKCFDWWHLSFEQRQDREIQVIQMRSTLAKQKVMNAWRVKLRQQREKIRGADKVDVVRCKLRAWRTWRRALLVAKQTHREERKSLLKGAYLVTRKKVDQRLIYETFLRWKIALMEHRTVHFRTQHLVRGAFSLWRLHLWTEKTMKEKEIQIIAKREEIMLLEAWQKWREGSGARKMMKLAESFHSRSILQSVFTTWFTESQDRALLRRKEALADRWMTRRAKRFAFSRWKIKVKELSTMRKKADSFHNTQLQSIQATALRLWILKEKETLFMRVKTAELKVKAFTRWSQTYAEMSTRLESLDAQFQANSRIRVLRQAYMTWQTTTAKMLASQKLASNRYKLKRKRQALQRWRTVLAKKRARIKLAEERDYDAVRKRVWSAWKTKHIEVKGDKLQHRHLQSLLKSTFTFWRARSAEKSRDMLAVGLINSKIEARIRKNCLERWTRVTIERKSILIEAGEKHDGQLLSKAWSRWIDACLRHEDMLSLSKSFLDINREKLIKRVFSNWIIAARAERNRRERMEQFVHNRARKIVVDCFDEWYDRYIDSTLRSKEYEVLLLRQRSAMSTTFARWKSKVNSLPAIRLYHARLKSNAFHHWKDCLPKARQNNQAYKHDRITMMSKGFRHWLSLTKAKRSLRAAARFGGPSAVRLSAAAHLRQRSGGNPYGPKGSSSPAPILRSRSIERRKSISSRSENQVSRVVKRDEDVSLRESDLVMSSVQGKDNELRAGPLHTPITRPQSSSGTPAFQRWMQNQRQIKGREENLADVDASSEPPSSLLDQRWSRREKETNRTPSPTASQVQSEVTVRTKLSPRKMQIDADSTMSWLKARRRAGNGGHI